MKQWAWGVALVAVLSGCASGGKSSTDAVVQVQEGPSSGVKTVAFAPQPLVCERQAQCPMLGVRWSSATPGRAVLLMTVQGAQTQVHSVEFVGRPYAPIKVRALASGVQVPQGVTAFAVPMDTLERVALGKSTWLRVHTDVGVLEEDMLTGERSSLASDALKRLVVEAYRGTDKEVALGLSEMFAKPYAPNYGQ